MPSFPRIDKFPGRVLHSHAFRNSSHFKDKNVLVVRSSISAEDIVLQCLQYGAKSIVCTWKTKPMGFLWVPQVTERPLIMIDGSTIHFNDSSTTEVNDIILCTGYHYSFPFLEDDLRLKTVLGLYPVGLYKGICCIRGGNSKLLYIRMQAQYYSYTMFDVQAKWVVDYITAELSLPDT